MKIGTFFTTPTKLFECEVLAIFRLTFIALFRDAVLDGADFFLVLLPAGFSKLTKTDLKEASESVNVQFLFHFSFEI